MRFLQVSFFCLLSLFFLSAPVSAKVLVTIKPIHSIASYLLQGIDEPDLLIESHISPHQFRLKPSDIKTLKSTELVIFVDPLLESNLYKTLKEMDDKNKLRITAAPGLDLIKNRRHDFWYTTDIDDHSHEHHHDHKHNKHHDQNTHDPHVWLSAKRMIVVSKYMAKRFQELYPKNKEDIADNLEKMIGMLEEVSAYNHQLFAPLKDKKYFVYHDAYMYFESDHGLMPSGVISSHANNQTSIKKIRKMKQLIDTQNIKCVFKEPQFPDKMIRVLADKTNLKTYSIDPLGVDIDRGEYMYFEMMNAIAESFSNCLME